MVRMQPTAIRASLLDGPSSGGGSGAAGGSLDLRLPADRLPPAIEALSDARPCPRTDAEHRGRHRHLRLEAPPARRSAGRAARAPSPARPALTTNETASIRASSITDRESMPARRSLRVLRNRVSYARVTVAIAPDSSVSGGGGWTLGSRVTTPAAFSRHFTHGRACLPSPC